MKILQFSTHPTLRPRHGGQLRSHHIGRVLEEAGFDVARLSIGMRPPGHRDDAREPLIDVGPTAFWHKPEIAAHRECLAVVGDYLSTAAVLDHPGLLAECDRHVQGASADAILLEHPWTWPIVARLPEVASGRLPVIYSSQNVEAHLKRRIAGDTGIAVPPAIFAAIDDLEQGLVRNAAAVAACTQADAAVFNGWGARCALVVPNGGVTRQRDHLVGALPVPLEPGQRYALVVGSIHPPNVSGFMELVLPALPRLRPGHRIVLAGGMGAGVAAEMERAGIARLASARLVVLGEVDAVTLDAAIANAHVLLLPILYGGGSNVKTAEALLSGSAVVASGTAMRGYDGFDGVPGLTVAGDAAESFAAAVLGVLDRAPEHSDTSHPMLRTLLWDSTVQPLVGLLRGLAAGDPAGDAAAGA